MIFILELTKRTPDLTRRDIGEMLTANPPLRNIELARAIKVLWADGMKQGKIARATCQKVDYVKKFTACFYRASNHCPTEPGEGQNLEKVVQWPEKREAKQKPQKTPKTLTVNFSAPIQARHTFRGVTYRRGRGWQAQIRVGKKVRYLGLYKTIEEAAAAYNEYVNFIL